MEKFVSEQPREGLPEEVCFRATKGGLSDEVVQSNQGKFFQKRFVSGATKESSSRRSFVLEQQSESVLTEEIVSEQQSKFVLEQQRKGHPKEVVQKTTKETSAGRSCFGVTKESSPR